MIDRPLRLALAALPLAALVAAAPVYAFESKKKDHEAARIALLRKEVLPLTRILAIAAERAPGEIIEVELEEDDGRLKYDLKILAKNGRVRELELDARSGATLKLEDD